MSSQYNDYLNDHISNVIKGFEWIYDNLPEIFDGISANMMVPQINAHDDSKWSDEEYQAYDDYFYGNKTPEVEQTFDEAWLHHQHNNPHHWQHWLLREDDGEVRALEMPKEYALEMICDWWAFSWKKENLTEIFDWYANNKPKMILHENTLEYVERVLTLLRNKIGGV